MSEARFPPDDPRAWLSRARSSLIRARNAVPGVYLEDLCFDAQQAAEKALKAVMVKLSLPIKRTHDLADLLTLIQRTGLEAAGLVHQAAKLNRYAVAARYPGLDEPVTQEEYEEALRIAEAVLQWAEDAIGVGAGQ